MKDLLFRLGLFLAGFLLPIKTVGLAIGFFVLIDVITGIWASVKTGQRVSSDRFSRTVTKTVVYLVALLVASIAERHVFGDSIPILKVVSGFVAGTELLSIYENLTRISGIDFRKVIVEKILPGQKEKDDRGEGP